jgi:hypothetical protein
MTRLFAALVLAALALGAAPALARAPDKISSFSSPPLATEPAIFLDVDRTMFIEKKIEVDGVEEERDVGS